MAIDKNTSQRLSVLRFPLIVGIVFLHAYGLEFNFQGGAVGGGKDLALASFVQDLISQGVTRIAVPLFYLMSGFLLFVSMKLTGASYLQKIKSRLRSLLIPFVFWNVATFLLIAMAQSTPVLSQVFSGNTKAILDFSPFDFANALFGLNKSPIAYQFWFIRDLMVLVEAIRK